MTVEVAAQDLPFPHILIASALTRHGERACLDAVESMQWDSRTGEFYRYQVPLPGAALADFRTVLAEERCWDSIRRACEVQFQCELLPAPDFDLQRYTANCGIGPHTDAPASEVRCVISLNESWSTESGGIWLLGSDSAFRNGRSFVAPVSNCGFAFATGQRSYHGLSVVHSGISYAIVARFLAR